MQHQQLDVTFGSHDEDELTDNPAYKLSHYIEQDENERLGVWKRGGEHGKKTKDSDKFNTITFKNKPKLYNSNVKKQQTMGTNTQVNTPQHHQRPPHMLSPIDREMFQKVTVVKNPHDYDSKETLYNFKSSQKPQANMGGGFKMPKKTSEQGTGTIEALVETVGESAQKILQKFNQTIASTGAPMSRAGASQLNYKSVMKMSQTQSQSFHGASINNIQSLQSNLDQAKRFRQKSMLDEVVKKGAHNHSSAAIKIYNQDGELTENKLFTKQFNNDAQSATPSLLSNAMILKQHQQLKQSLSLGPSKEGGNTGNFGKATWMEEQRLKRIIKESDALYLSYQNNREEDPYYKAKMQTNFLLEQGIQALQITSGGDIANMFERNINNVAFFIEQQNIQLHSEKAMQLIQIEKLNNHIADQQKVISELKDREATEENMQRMFQKAKESLEERTKKVDIQIEDLFTNDAIMAQGIEPPPTITQTTEERDEEDEVRHMNHRRMVWLEKDLEMMQKLIQNDITETIKSQIEIQTEFLLSIESAGLKDNVAIGIQQQIANFHLKLEDLLKENQKLLKAKEPEKMDRGYQTEVWNMERYLDELEALKRRKYLADKENRDLKEKMNVYKERVKKMKEDTRKFLKKAAETRDRERTLDAVLEDKDNQMKEFKKEYENKLKDVENTLAGRMKDIKMLQSQIESQHTAKVSREVEIMKREEEIHKKVEALIHKEQETKLGSQYFQKEYLKQIEEIKILKENLTIATNKKPVHIEVERKRGRVLSASSQTDEPYIDPKRQSSTPNIQAEHASTTSGDMLANKSGKAVKKGKKKVIGTQQSAVSISIIQTSNNLQLPTHQSNTQLRRPSVSNTQLRRPSVSMNHLPNVNNEMMIIPHLEDQSIALSLENRDHLIRSQEDLSREKPQNMLLSTAIGNIALKKFMKESKTRGILISDNDAGSVQEDSLEHSQEDNLSDIVSKGITPKENKQKTFQQEQESQEISSKLEDTDTNQSISVHDAQAADPNMTPRKPVAILEDAQTSPIAEFIKQNLLYDLTLGIPDDQNFLSKIPSEIKLEPSRIISRLASSKLPSDRQLLEQKLGKSPPDTSIILKIVDDNAIMNVKLPKPPSFTSIPGTGKQTPINVSNIINRTSNWKVGDLTQLSKHSAKIGSSLLLQMEDKETQWEQDNTPLVEATAVSVPNIPQSQVDQDCQTQENNGTLSKHIQATRPQGTKHTQTTGLDILEATGGKKIGQSHTPVRFKNQSNAKQPSNFHQMSITEDSNGKKVGSKANGQQSHSQPPPIINKKSTAVNAIIQQAMNNNSSHKTPVKVVEEVKKAVFPANKIPNADIPQQVKFSSQSGVKPLPHRGLEIVQRLETTLKTLSDFSDKKHSPVNQATPQKRGLTSNSNSPNHPQTRSNNMFPPVAKQPLKTNANKERTAQQMTTHDSTIEEMEELNDIAHVLTSTFDQKKQEQPSKARQDKMQQKIRKGLEKNLNQLTLTNKAGGGKKNSEQVLEKMMTNNHFSSIGETEDEKRGSIESSQSRRPKINKTSLATHKFDSKPDLDIALEINNVPHHQQLQSSKARWSVTAGDDPARIQEEQDGTDILEYYASMRPEFPFQGLVQGTPAPQSMAKLLITLGGDPNIHKSLPTQIDKSPDESRRHHYSSSKEEIEIDDEDDQQMDSEDDME